jgi:hypothetical protein
MLKLTDAQLTTLREIATLIPRAQRPTFLQHVAAALQGNSDPGDGDVNRAARAAARRVMRDRGNGRLGDGIEGCR